MLNTYKCIIRNPNLEHIGYVRAVANTDDKHDRSAPSHFHWKTLKCRMIIFSNSSILACPDKKDIKQVHIVFNKMGDDYDKLISLFLKFSLTQEGAIEAAPPEVYQMCFSYTLSARMAPAWNTVGFNYYINNRDFLTARGPQDGVKYQIWTDDQSTVMDLKPVKINLSLTDEKFLPGEWIRVLPSLNKAIVEDYYETLPKTGSFKCYKDLRRHWKNIHGYRLPEEECNYYSIAFWRGEPLTYPEICVLRNFPIITPMPKPSEKMVLSKFLACLKSRMPRFLGIPLTVQCDEDNSNQNDKTFSDTQAKDTQSISLCTPTQCPKF